MHKITIDGIPVKHKFHYEDNDLHLPSPKGGFIGSLLGSLIPIGIDLISGLFKKKSANGVYGQGMVESNNNHKHLLKIFKNKAVVGEHEISPEAGAILMDKNLIKMIHKHKGDLEKVAHGVYGEGVYAQGAASSMHGGSQISMNAVKTGVGVYGGRVGSLENINDE